MSDSLWPHGLLHARPPCLSPTVGIYSNSGLLQILYHLSRPGGSEVKVSACNAGDLGSIPGSVRSPGEENGNPLQYSCLENPMDSGAWWDTVHVVTKSRTWLSYFTFFFHAHWVGDTIQPSHLLSSPSPPAFNLSQHQSLFKWVSSLHQVAKVLEFQL